MSIVDDEIDKQRKLSLQLRNAEPPPRPQLATATGFREGLIEVEAEGGTQLRTQQGGRAIAEGRQLPAQDKTAVFTGRARRLEEPEGVFVSANRRNQLADLYRVLVHIEFFWPPMGWLNDSVPISTPAASFINDAYSKAIINDQFRSTNVYSPTFEIPKRNLRMVVTDGVGHVGRIALWEDHARVRSTTRGADLGTDDDPFFISYPSIYLFQNKISVIWFLRRSTSDGFNTEVYETRFSLRLGVPLSEGQIGTIVEQRIMGPGGGITRIFPTDTYTPQREEYNRFTQGKSRLYTFDRSELGTGDFVAGILRRLGKTRFSEIRAREFGEFSREIRTRSNGEISYSMTDKSPVVLNDYRADIGITTTPGETDRLLQASGLDLTPNTAEYPHSRVVFEPYAAFLAKDDIPFPLGS